MSPTSETQLSNTVALSLYTRHNCSLCDDMLYTLQGFTNELNFSVATIDIDTDDQLLEQYNDLVPVLTLGSQEICHHFFDRQALLQALDAERANS